jgi:rhomboid family protein
MRPASVLGSGMPPLTRGVRWLMIATAVLTIAATAIGAWLSAPIATLIAENTILVPGMVFHGRVWTLGLYTLLASPFLNSSVLGLIIAELMLWMFGGTLERHWGTQRFLTFYFATTVLAGAAACLVGLVAPDVAHYGYFGIGTALMALSAAFALSFPDSQIMLSFVVPLRARYLIHASIGITLLYVIMEGTVIPFIAPLFGLVAGIVFSRGALKGPQHLLLRIRVWWIERRMAGRKLRVVPGRDEPRSKSGSDGYLH